MVTTSIYFTGLILIHGGCNLRCIQQWCVNLLAALDMLPISFHKDLDPKANTLHTKWCDLFNIPSRKRNMFIEKAKKMARSISSWGPMVWQGLHDMSAFYVPRNHTYFRDLILTIPYVLPCIICRMNARRHIRPVADELISECTVIQYMNVVISLHNQVSLDKYATDDAIIYPSLPLMWELSPPSTKKLLEIINHHSRCRGPPL